MKKPVATRMGRWLVGGVALAAAATVVCAPSASAASTVLVNGLVQGMCLDGQTMDGVTLTAVAQVIPCNSGPAQQWTS